MLKLLLEVEQNVIVPRVQFVFPPQEAYFLEVCQDVDLDDVAIGWPLAAECDFSQFV